MRKSLLLLIDNLAMCLMCTGCTRAPSVGIIGSFFPVWMLCLATGVVGAFVARAVLLHYGLEDQMQPLWVFYPCAVILCTCFLWLLFFR